MMTSVGSERTRGTRDKAQISATQLTQPQKPVVQATAEQIRLAQMIYDKNDADFEDKVKQLMEVTGKNQDDCIVALHDCNGDMNRAINILLEGGSDTTSWETVGGKKKSLGKESSENKENREKRGDREVSRGRGSSSRRGRGGSRGREFRAEENGMDNSQGDRPSDRGKRGRGRALKPPSYLLQMLRIASSSAVFQSFMEEIQLDGQIPLTTNILSFYKIIGCREKGATASVVLENFPSIDLVTLLQKPVTSSQETEANSFETPQQQSFGQALVFTNSQHNSQMALGASNTSAVNSYSPQSLSSVLCSGFGELGTSKLANSTGSQNLEQLKSPGLGQFTSQGTLSTNSPVSTTTASSWDVKSSISQSSILSQFDFKSQPEPSPVLSQLTQRQQQQQQPASAAPPPGLESFASRKARESSPVDTSIAVNKMLHLPSLSVESQSTPALQTQQKQVKAPKRRIPPVSKVVQESTYSTPAITSASLSCSSQSASPVTTTSSYDQASVHSRITYQSSVPPTEPAPAAVTNGHGSVRTQPALDTTSTVPASKTETSPPSLPAKGSSLPSTTAAPALLLPSAPPHTAPLPSLPQSNDLASSSLTQLSSSLSDHQSSLSSASALSSSATHPHTSVENSTVLPPSSTFSVAATLATTSSVSTMTSSMASTTNTLGLNATGVSLPAPTTRATPLVSSGSQY
ncbi:hypothetical protein JD844_008116 [Phrynosoma platyrhinos]|uniref:UBA domain-containing protein n=1 Tax=Phrynosoma platyrhinos TaxID=52577 RepID=A0ABQ7TDF8_PHRPL|nr:hypothetical protein JD844_008116 [Phrynosoma platyrhinos]